MIDSILRQARKQYKHKDVFAPRFAINLTNTFDNILRCDADDKVNYLFFMILYYYFS